MAREYAYDYSAYTAERALPYKSPKTQEREIPKIKPRVKTKYSLNRILSVALIATIFVVVFRYTLINEMNANNTKLSRELSAVTAETDLARITLDRTTDLNYVENTAREMLGMDFPQSYQMTNVTLTFPDKAVKAENQAGVFQTVGNFFGDILEYLY